MSGIKSVRSVLGVPEEFRHNVGTGKFFENTFSDDVGNILFDQTASGNPVSLMSPDNTSDGWLKKKWKIIDDKRCLIKGEVVPHSRNRIMKFSQAGLWTGWTFHM